MKTFRVLTWAAILMMITSCSTEYHLRQIRKKDPTLLEPKTIVRLDTFVTPPSIIRDTTVLAIRDTVERETESIRYKLIRDVDTFYMEAECKSDTIFRTIEVECPPAIQPQIGVNKWWKIGVLIAVSFFGLTIITILLRRAFEI